MGRHYCGRNDSRKRLSVLPPFSQRGARLEYGDTVMPILSYLLQLLIFTHASRPPPQTAGLLSSSYIRNLWLPHSSRIGAFFSWESLLGSWLC
ncbi:hypothetical protein GBAR_LOCUS24520 [Geodia barretti]|uniref:Uncharacterized protein n=1 Tax=Geodia barretti TaxID=519541 RepID=A0AA35TA99_GEOBA|nr:hypothetical protein GBAR_LOCUS24520 [Geodia barretti]